MEKRKFNVMDVLGEQLAGVADLNTSGPEQIEYIDIGLLDGDERNFYQLTDIDELADNIQMCGLQQPIRVRAGEGGRFTIVSGHRRRAALAQLVEKGLGQFRRVPCIRETDDASPALQELRLIFANSSTRKLTSAEIGEQAERVEALLYQLKEDGFEFPEGRMRDVVAAACNTHGSKLARIKVIREHLLSNLRPAWDGGKMPEQYEELLKLPGIGSYTAGAISSIAFGHPVPAVDGNVLRVLSRVLESHEDILKQSVKKHFEELLRETMPKERTSAFTQGMIEIGAIVCVPNGKPRCEECPLESLCLAKRHGLLDSIPYKAPKKPRKIEEKTVLLICSSKKTAIRKRPDQGLLASLYEFPNTDHYLTADEVREYLEKEMAALGCRVYPSQSNFIYFDTGKDPAWIQEQLMEKGIRIGAFEMSRVSVGTMEEFISKH